MINENFCNIETIHEPPNKKSKSDDVEKKKKPKTPNSHEKRKPDHEVTVEVK